MLPTPPTRQVCHAAAVRTRPDVADVETAFSTLAFEPTVPLPGHGDVPLNVARICQWTTMCTKLDFHANPAERVLPLNLAVTEGNSGRQGRQRHTTG